MQTSFIYDGTPRFAHLYARSTGKERDTESGNDYFEARYYSSAMGRFLIPDWSAKAEPVPYAKMDDPQTLNLYNYMRNNPLGGVDEDGHNPFLLLALAGGGALADAEGGAAAGSVLGGPAGAVVGAAIGIGIGLWVNHEISEHESQPAAPAATPEPATAAAPTTQPGQSDADFVVTPGGTAVATDPTRVDQSLRGAPGVTQTPSRDGTGTIHTGVSTKSGNKVDVRTMPVGNAHHGPRTIITATGTNRPATPDGTHTNDKKDSHIPNNARHPGTQ